MRDDPIGKLTEAVVGMVFVKSRDSGREVTSDGKELSLGVLWMGRRRSHLLNMAERDYSALRN